MNSFLMFNQQQMTPEQKKELLTRQLQQQIMGQPAQNIAQGAGQLAAGIGMGLDKFNKQGEAFPAAPGGAQPGLGTSLANFFTRRNNGGLY